MKKIEKVCCICGKEIKLSKEGESYGFDPLERKYYHLRCEFGDEADDVVRRIITEGDENFKVIISALKSVVVRGDDEILIDLLNHMCAHFFTQGMTATLHILKRLALEVEDEAKEYKR